MQELSQFSTVLQVQIVLNGIYFVRFVAYTIRQQDASN